MSSRLSLPIDDSLPAIRAALREQSAMVLAAPPGAGKTTRVPTALLDEPWLGNRKIVMLEPRRLAARRAAEYMAGERGETVGRTIGYRIRGENAVSTATRIEVLTEGILTRMIQNEPELPGVALIIFDEFHERSIHADLALALALDARQQLRPDLRVLVMSATLDLESVRRILEPCAILTAGGRSYPVETVHARFPGEKPLEHRVADTILRAIGQTEGDILTFLPGRREIMRTADQLAARQLPEDIRVHVLHGDAPYREQSAALAPAPAGIRKVILSTAVAETSLTIDGVRTVVDSGVARVARFDPRRGMTGLVTVPVSKATAEQRRGRAGRQAPGRCYRLWTEQEHAQLPDQPVPEIRSADLAPLALELARWGDPDAQSLRFIDPPPSAHLAQAYELLTSLEILDASRRLTAHGRSVADAPLHPRLAHMVRRAKELGLGGTACRLAALLEERDVLGGKDTDIDVRSRLHALGTVRSSGRGSEERIRSQAERIARWAGVDSPDDGDDERAGLALAFAYPDRIGRRRERGSGKYQLSNGMTATLPAGSLLGREEYLAVGDVDGTGDVRIFLAAPLREQDLFDAFQSAMIDADEVGWDDAGRCVVARRLSRLGALVLKEVPARPEPAQIAEAMTEGVRRLGIDALPWEKESGSFRERSEWIRRFAAPPDGWPDLSTDQLMRTLVVWLQPFLGEIRTADHLRSLPLPAILRAMFDPAQLHLLDRLAPTHIQLPSGTRAPLDYSTGEHPDLGVKLQELFGQTETPRIGNGRVPVRIHLLSPAGRPLAVTQDLRSFWMTVYPEIRTQMRARYPRHPWPEDPLNAKPTGRALPRKRR